VGVNASQGAARDVARDVAASAGGAKAYRPEAFEEFWEIFHADPVELDILADGDVGYAVAEVIGEVGNGTGLFAGEEAVGNADADHKVGDGFAFTVFAADDAEAVALGVNAPGAEIGAEPFGGNGAEAVTRELADFAEVVPGIFGAFETLDALGFGFF